ncbi:uncharacterized protein [Montipora foliosa]|uniref:uncharacterized protein n=1 Tax=Montipora foliosa TaxID=591990 RepID=UPI0035F210D4
MEICKVRFIMVAITFLMFSAVVYADPFSDAFKKVNAAKPHINYKTFCKEIAPGGEEKLACRIKAVPSIGFLVCKNTSLYGTPCLQVIQDEVRNIGIIKKAGINTVGLSPKPSQEIIEGVKCGLEKSVECSGFLEEWVPYGTGRFEHIRDSIVRHNVPDLIAEVIKYTVQNLKNSARDLDKIIAYMQDGTYRQICDLQGFFLTKGGFKVNDVPQIRERMGLRDRCDTDHPTEREPTTEEVLDALEQMSKAFKKHGFKKAFKKELVSMFKSKRRLST